MPAEPAQAQAAALLGGPLLGSNSLAEDLSAVWFEFENSHMGRGLNVVELSRAGKPWVSVFVSAYITVFLLTM